jgi:imidazolonepropionase-like amidohydrolase
VLIKWEDLVMSGISLLCSLIGVSLALVIGTSTAADAQTTALRGARVIDGRGGAPIDNATIVIRDGRIVAVGPSAGTPVPSGAEVVDYAGKTIIPGLISDHSHVGIFVGLKATPENYNRDAILRQLKQLEAYGVTTVMALGLNAPLFYELRPELHAGRLPGADLFGADQGIGVVGGQRAG